MIAWFTALPAGRKVAFGLGALIALVLAIAALAAGVNAHDRVVRQGGRDEVQALWSAEKEARNAALADFQTALGNALQPRFDVLARAIGAIDTSGARVSVELPRAVSADPRYRDPACKLTDPVRDQLNAARGMPVEALP